MHRFNSFLRGQGLRRLSRVAVASFAIAIVPTMAFGQSGYAVVPNSVRHSDVTRDNSVPAPANDNVFFAVSLAPKDLAGLQAFVKDVSDPKSANYRKFLTPEEVGERFGPAQADVDATVAFLQSGGFTIHKVSKNKMVVIAEGTASQVSKAFQTQLGYAEAEDGTKFRTNLTPLHMPAGIAPKVVSIDGIDTSIRHTFAGLKKGKTIKAATKTKLALTDPTTSTLNPPLYDSAIGSSVAYGQGFYGQGVNIAIANWDGYRLANIPLWTSTYSMPVPAGGAGSNIHIREVGTGTTYGAGTPGGEGDLDLQAVLMAAPLANVYDYDDATSDHADPITTYTDILDDNIADIVTESYGWSTSSVRRGTRSYNSATWTSAYNLHLSMAAQGITYLAATGDSGTGNFPATGTTYGYPDIDPTVLAVGGSVITADETTGAMVGETSWGYATNSGGSAGGTGGFDPYDTPAHGFAFNVAPSYQTSYLTQAGTYNYRLVPDVVNFAGGQNGLGNETSPYAGWSLIIYYDDPPNYPLGTGIFIDGTSVASPSTAGSLAGMYSAIFANTTPLANRSNVRFGMLQPFIYSQGGSASAVTDITAGISVGNLPGTSTPTPPGPGWDFATGWGSLNFAGLLDYTTYATHLAVLHPNYVITGSASTTLTVTGYGYAPGQTVLWNGTPLATSYVSPTELQATLPANLLGLASSNFVTVTSALTPTLGPNTDTRQFDVKNPLPAISSVSPTTAVLHGSDYTITVYGSNFVSTSTVKWNNKGLPTTFINSGELQATVGSQYLAHRETADITVANAKPGGGYSNQSPVTVE